MQISLRPLLLATGALLLSSQHAAAQFVELLTEAQVTLQASLTTTSVTELDGSRKSTPVVTTLSNAKIIEELRAAGVIPELPATGWTLVAVRNAPADLAYVDASFYLYAVNGSQRIPVPSSKFASTAYGSVDKYTERHQGQYIHSSKGASTNHVAYAYRPVFTPPNDTARYTVENSNAEGFATVSFVGKDLSDTYEIFFYAITSMRVTAIGSFQGSSQVGENEPVPATGLITISVSVGAPKLVPATNYPEVPSFPGRG